MTRDATSMVWTSIGGIEIHGFWHLPRFLWLAQSAKKSALATEGCREVHLFRRDGRFFAISVWDSPVAMKRYAASGMHARLMADHAPMFRSALNTVMRSEMPPSRDEAVAHWTEVHDVRRP